MTPEHFKATAIKLANSVLADITVEGGLTSKDSITLAGEVLLTANQLERIQKAKEAQK
ncbi:MAG: hypothetical protein AAF468_06405 [Pseudomonadota bacterium]